MIKDKIVKGVSYKEKPPTENQKRYRIHIGRTSTALYSIYKEKQIVKVLKIMTIEKAYKKYRY